MTPSNFRLLLEKAGKHTYSCTMLFVPESDPLHADLLSLIDTIDEADLAGDGREDEMHITAKYGTHTSDVEDVKRAIETTGIKSVTAEIVDINTFPPSEHSDGATVLKCEVKSDDLVAINKAISSSLKCTDSFPNYNPHLTLAYVKTETAGKYLDGDWGDDLIGRTFTSREFVFSKQDGEQIRFTL